MKFDLGAKQRDRHLGMPTNKSLQSIILLPVHPRLLPTACVARLHPISYRMLRIRTSISVFFSISMISNVSVSP